MPSTTPPPARSHYRGLRLSVTQAPGDRPCIVTLATKAADRPWDDWSLLFPAIRVPMPPQGINSYEGILEVVVAAVQAVLRADRDYR